MSEHANQTIEVEELEAGWLTTDQAASRMRLSRRMFERRWRNGDISAPRYKVDGDRQFYYDPSDLRRGDLDDMQEADIVDMPTAALLAQAYSHNEVLLKQVSDLSMQLLAHQSEENEKLRNRCNQLEESHTSLISAREEMLNDHHAREIAMKQAQDEAARKDKALEGLLELAPKVLQTHTASKMNSGAVKFLQSIQPSQIEMLLQLNEMGDGDVLTEDQVSMLRALLQQKQKEAEKEAPETETETTAEER